jgi:di/tricarboxylate transporter
MSQRGYIPPGAMRFPGIRIYERSVILNDIGITFAIIAAVVVLFVWNRVPVAIVALAAPLALYFTGVLGAGEALAGLGDPVVIFIAALLVVSAGLESAGVTTWAGQILVEKAGTSRSRLLVLMTLLAAAMSALIGLIGTTAALLPVIVVAAVRLGRAPSQLLMPLAFASSAGGLLTLAGSPVNVITSQAAQDAGLGAFGFFEFAVVGVPLVLGVMAITLLLGQRLLPERGGVGLPRDFGVHADTLVEQYRLEDGLHRLRVKASSSYVGTRRNAIDLGKYPGLSLVGFQEGSGAPVGRPTLEEGDVLLVRGDAVLAGLLATDMHLAIREEGGAGGVADTLFNRTSGLAEVLIPPRSKLIGETVFPGMVTSSGDLIVLAVQRGGADIGPEPTLLAAGDHLLLQGTWEALDRRLADPSVLVVDSPEVVRRQAVALGPGAKQAIAILALLVILLATGVVPPAIAGLICACATVLARVLTLPQAYKGIDWNTCILIGGMIPLSTAMTKTGAADLMADTLLGVIGDGGPFALLAGLFVLTAILGQLISNTATALILVPIAVAAAIEIGISPRSVLMSLTVAAGASFLTPVATPSNLMVMGPGGYRFGDYWKFGLPCLLWFFVVAVFFVPLYWRL